MAGCITTSDCKGLCCKHQTRRRQKRMPGCRLHQPNVRLSQDLPVARREQLLPAPIRMYHACNQVQRKLLQAHRQGDDDEDEGGLKSTKRTCLLLSACVHYVLSQLFGSCSPNFLEKKSKIIFITCPIYTMQPAQSGLEFFKYAHLLYQGLKASLAIGCLRGD